MTKPKRDIILASTGASGASLTLLALDLLVKHPEVRTLHFCPSKGFNRVWEMEEKRPFVPPEGVTVWDALAFDSPAASGSSPWHAMAVIPCSTGYASAIAAGLAQDLPQRAAQVAMKEHRPLVLLPRESPLSTLHLKAFHTLSTVGALVAPLCPPHYTSEKAISEAFHQLLLRLPSWLGLAPLPHFEWGEST